MSEGLVADEGDRLHGLDLELYRDNAGEFRFRLVASNNENILLSEGYTVKVSAENGIASVQTNAPIEARYEKKSTSNSNPYFVLNAANGETIGKSQMYASKASRDKGIEVVKRTAPTALRVLRRRAKRPSRVPQVSLG